MGGSHPRRYVSQRRRNRDAGSESEPKSITERQPIAGHQPFTEPESLAGHQPIAKPEPFSRHQPDHRAPVPQPSCSPIGTANMTIAGGGGSFSPTSLTINPATRVTWTNIGNDRARVRDVATSSSIAATFSPANRIHLPSACPAPTRSRIHRGSAHATIIVTGIGPSPSPSPSRFAEPRHFAKPLTEPKRFPEPRTSPSPETSPSASPSPDFAEPKPFAEPGNFAQAQAPRLAPVLRRARALHRARAPRQAQARLRRQLISPPASEWNWVKA